MFEKSFAFMQDQSTRASRKKKLIGMVIFFILIIIMVLVVPWKETWTVILSSNLSQIAIAFLLLIPTQILSAASFYVVAKSQSMQLSIWKIFLINSTINFYEIVLPATFFGSGLRWYRYSQEFEKTRRIFCCLCLPENIHHFPGSPIKFQFSVVF